MNGDKMESQMHYRKTKEYIELRRSIYAEILGTMIRRFDDDPDWDKNDIIMAAWEYADAAAEFEFELDE